MNVILKFVRWNFIGITLKGYTELCHIKQLSIYFTWLRFHKENTNLVKLSLFIINCLSGMQTMLWGKYDHFLLALVFHISLNKRNYICWNCPNKNQYVNFQKPVCILSGWPLMVLAHLNKLRVQSSHQTI